MAPTPKKENKRFCEENARAVLIASVFPRIYARSKWGDFQRWGWILPAILYVS